MRDGLVKIFFAAVMGVILIGCSVAPDSYDTFSYRQSDFIDSDITISEGGLSQEQVKSILATRFPPSSTASIAVIFLYDHTPYSNQVNDIAYYIMNEGKNINDKIEKLVPIPKILIPKKLSFEKIQELGIRSLCEYTLIFYTNSKKSMTFEQFFKGEFKFESDIEYSLIDNQTTAIIASDRLYSSLIKKKEWLHNDDIAEAENEIYTLQAQLLKEKLNTLFNNNI